MLSYTPVPSLDTVLTEEALNRLLEPVRTSVQREELLWPLFFDPIRTPRRTPQCSATPSCSVPTTRGNPSTSMNLYTPTRSTRDTPAPEIFVPQQYKRETSILSTDSRFDPNDHFHDPLLDPRYLSFLFRMIYERVRNPTPNFPSCIVVPVERLIYRPWFEHPDPTVHLEDYTVHCNINEVYVQATPYGMDHRRCILGYSPTPVDLFPSGQGDIFSLFFLKEDIVYPWLRSAGLQVAKNKSRFRTAWIRGEIDYGHEFPGQFFRALSSIQLKFAKFIIDIADYVINLAARKIAICNRDAFASYLALGVDEHSDWVLSQDFWQYFTDTRGPNVPHVSFLSRTLRSRCV